MRRTVRTASLSAAALAALVLATAAAAGGDPLLPRGGFVWRDLGLLAAADEGYAILHARAGPGWQVGFDPSGEGTRWLIPGDLPSPGPIDTAPPSVAWARHLLERFAPGLGVGDASDFVLSRATRAGDVVGIDFRQTLEGLPVRTPRGDARVRFRFHAPTGRLSAIGTDAAPARGLPAPEAATLEGVLPRAAACVGPGARFHGAETYFLASPSGLSRVHEVRFTGPDGAGDRSVVVDAATGGIVEVRNETRHVDVIGNVTGGTRNHPGAAFSMRPLPDIKVTVRETGRFGHTDSAGDFRITNAGAAGVTVEGRLYGLWASVGTVVPPGVTFSQAAVPGVSEAVRLNPGSDEIEDAQVAGYLFVTLAHRYLEGIVPGFTTGHVQSHLVTVNDVAACTGGSYSGHSNIISTRRAVPGTCNNGATEDILAHEYGHSLHDWFHGSISPAGFSEGIGDHVALFLTDQRIVGRNYYPAAPTNIRDYRAGGAYNAVTWPQADPYLEGATWAGFCLDFKDNVIGRLGAAAGRARAELVTIGQYIRDPSDIPDAVMECFLQDDNNGNLMDGTPFCPELIAAADRHRLPRPGGCGFPPARDRYDFVVSNGFGFYGDSLMRVVPRLGPELGTFGKILDFPIGDASAVMMEIDNWSYVAASGNTLYWVNMHLLPPVALAVGAAPAVITGIDLDQDGSVVAALANQTLVRFPRVGPMAVIAAGVGAPNGIPNCVAVDLDRGDYVVGIYDNPGSIVRVDPTTGVVSPAIGAPIAQVTGIDQDVTTGDFYVTRFGALERMAPGGAREVVSAAPEMATANGLEVEDMEGRSTYVAVVEAGNAPTGVYLVKKLDGTITNVSVCPRGSSDGLGPTEVCFDMSRYLSGFGPAAPRSTHELRIADNANPGQVYALRASFSVRPGIALGDGRTLWLTADPLFFATPLLPTVFQDFVGTLDGSGRATAGVYIPSSTPTGLRIYVSGLIVNPGAGAITRVLNTVGFTVR